VIPSETLVRTERTDGSGEPRVCTWGQWKAENADLFSPREFDIIASNLARGERFALDTALVITRA
jgi:hypothetical protein